MDQTLNAKMRARMEEVRAQVAERDDLIEVIAIALLTRKNVFILGDTGQAKSYAVNLFREGITGARQFERLMSKQTDEEALFGRLDLSSLIPGGVPDEVLSRDSRYQDMQRQLDACLADRRDTRALVEEMEQYRKALSALHSGAPRTIIRGKMPEQSPDGDRPLSWTVEGADPGQAQKRLCLWPGRKVQRGVGRRHQPGARLGVRDAGRAGGPAALFA